MKKKRYLVAEKGRKRWLLSNSSAAILMAVLKQPSISYDQLRKLTKIPQASLYEFCRRLEQERFIKRTTVLSRENGLARVRTVIKLSPSMEGVHIFTPTVVR